MAEFRGLPACSCLVAWLPVFEDMIGRQPRLFQLAGDAKASAGFHRGGGSADYEPLQENELRIARNMGAAAWNRWWSNNYHSHMRLNGCSHNSIAQPQVEDLNEGRDGTGPLYDNAGKPDDGPRDGVRWPLRTWQEGIKWAQQKEKLIVDDQDRQEVRAIVRSELKRYFGDSQADKNPEKADIGQARVVNPDNPNETWSLGHLLFRTLRKK